MRGLFITLEGIEGTGKTTQARLLEEYLNEEGYATVLTEEPGGTAIGRKIRDVLLAVEHKEMQPVTELLLYNACRCQHLHDVIVPGLRAGKIVISDRFTDSTRAYQGYARGIDLALTEKLDGIATGGVKPDLTLLLDTDVEIGLRRNRKAQKIDRLELEDIAFHQRVRSGYLDLAHKEPVRISVIAASGDVEEIQRRIRETVRERLHRHSG